MKKFARVIVDFYPLIFYDHFRRPHKEFLWRSGLIFIDRFRTYSSRNLLASGDNITYTYDGSRQRVSATTTISGSSKTETSLYGPGRHLEMQSALTSGSVAYDYIWLGDLPVAEEDIAGSHTYWTAVDHRGAPIILTNASAAVAWQMDYRPFGNVYQVRTGSSIHEPLRFPGQEAELFDGSAGVNGFSGRLYNGMRWYRPQFARYTQADPIEYAGNPYNLYAYAENNPTNKIDPLGLIGEGEIIHAIASNPILDVEIIATEIVGGGPEDPAADAAVAAEIDAAVAGEEAMGSFSMLENTTDPGAIVTNITTNVNEVQVGQNLEANGGEITSSPENTYTTYTMPDGSTYTIRPSRSAPGNRAADYRPAGSRDAMIKINLCK